MGYIYLAWADKTKTRDRHIKVGRTRGIPSERYAYADRTTVVLAAPVSWQHLNDAEMLLKNYFSTRLSNTKISPERWVAPSNIDLSESTRLFRSFCYKHRLQCNRVRQKSNSHILQHQIKRVVSARVPAVLAQDVARICNGRSYDGYKENISYVITQALIEYRNKHRAEYPKIS